MCWRRSANAKPTASTCARRSPPIARRSRNTAATAARSIGRARSSNLGNALSSLGERENEGNWLREAVAAYREALKEYPRERAPLDWAMTQNNLGNALARLGERDDGIGRMDEAVQCYRDALGEFTRERAPMQWAMTQNNLGGALLRLGERDHRHRAVRRPRSPRYNDALAVFIAASAIYYVEVCWENRDRAIALLAERRGIIPAPLPPLPLDAPITPEPTTADRNAAI